MILILAYSKKSIIPIPLMNSFTFNGGEEHIRLDTSGMISSITRISVTVSLKSSSEVMKLLLVKDALDRISNVPMELKLGYMPYARQDRVCNEGEALSVKVMADLINNMKFDSVVILDPHSDVTPALLNNCKIRDSALGQAYQLFDDIEDKKLMLVAPDAGATKKVQALAYVYSMPFIQGYKIRDTETGELSGFGYIGDVTDKRLLIYDDICDGGGTFIGLAQKLIEGGALSVDLYVSHGIFSKGIKVLLDGGIRKIYTSNSMIENNPTDEMINAVAQRKLFVYPWS